MSSDASVRKHCTRRQHFFAHEQSVELLDDLVTEYIVDMCYKAAKMATYVRRNKIKVDDFKFALRRDLKKLGKVKELLLMSKVIADVRK
ncbi:transcription initiation factor IID, 18kD subunit-domain-containing protein [Tirmania nivea]|nr:transcription initiation factor IID, 18kD subunit-domain-containing protein [Tirmania nivea]